MFDIVTVLPNKTIENLQLRRTMITFTDPECAICVAYVGAECPGRCFMLDDATAVMTGVGWSEYIG